MGNEVVNGNVKWFSNDRGYGFVTIDGDASQTEYFVHYTSVDMDGYKTLRAGEAVLFELKPTEKGVQAFNVRRPI